MKILVIGASGTIGQAVTKRLSDQHQVISANHSGGDVQVDLGSPASIFNMYEQVGTVDAVISTAGLANFGPIEQLNDDEFNLAINNKLMGQINLFRLGQDYINKGGSITLTSGVLSKEPMPGSSVISLANGALESFVKAVALEVQSLRLNVVSPVFVKETMEMMGMDASSGVSASDTAKAYQAALLGSLHGTTLDVRDYI